MDELMALKKYESFSPREYMRAYRPHLFSDSLNLPTPSLDKDKIEYTLETLTSRKQEQEFEEFCRRLVTVEICPNLKPQTGPTGGGDSHVDASTYPVSDELALRVWWGSPAAPASVPMAFAFSCKKEWKQKAKADISKIAALERRFDVVYFITNQHARDKDRAALEMTLGKEHGFEVHILDRTWIVNSIVERKHEEIAAETLGVRGDEEATPQPGPRDIDRERRLSSLLQRFRDPGVYDGNDYALALDYLNAGLLSRGLEKPRHDTDGLMHRARDLAKRVGYRGLVIRAGYAHAWTSLWWFEDTTALADIYADIETYLAETPSADDCEMMVNLWKLLYGSVQLGTLSEDDAKLLARLRVLRHELVRLSRETDRPNNALQAKTELHLLDLVEAIENPDRAAQAFKGLGKCLERSARLGTYPAQDFLDMLTEAGELFGHLPGYEALFVHMRRVAAQRMGELAEGRLLFQRGMQLAQEDSPRVALKCLGQARVRLFKRETMREGLCATLACSDAYSAMGLYWAARMDAIAALHGAVGTPERLEEFPVEAMVAAIKLGWLELSLGRLDAFVTWRNVALHLHDWLKARHFRVQRAAEQLAAQQCVLGCWLLNLPPASLVTLGGLPDRLQSLGLEFASLGILWALGRREEVQARWPRSDEDVDIEEFFSLWKNQSADEQVPKQLRLNEEQYSHYEATMMGVTYSIRVRSLFPSILFAENLLGILEAALSTANWENLAFIVDRVDMSVDVADDGANPPPLDSLVSLQERELRFNWRPDMLRWLEQPKRNIVTAYLQHCLLLILLLATIDPMDDLKRELDRWHSEDTFSRALGTSPLSSQVLGILAQFSNGVAGNGPSTAASNVQ